MKRGDAHEKVVLPGFAGDGLRVADITAFKGNAAARAAATADAISSGPARLVFRHGGVHLGEPRSS